MSMRQRMMDWASVLDADDGSRVLDATVSIRRALSAERNPPIDEAVDAGVIPHMVRMLRDRSAPQLAFEAGWVLTNIAGGTSAHTTAVIDHGGADAAMAVLQPAEGGSFADGDLLEQCVWLVGNIAGDGVASRDMLLHRGFAAALAPILNAAAEGEGAFALKLVRNVAWAASNCLRGKPAPDMEKVRVLLKAMCVLAGHDDAAVAADCIWGMSYITEPDAGSSVVRVDGGLPFVRVCVARMQQGMDVCVPALRLVGNMASGDVEATQLVVDADAVPVLITLTGHHKRNIAKEAFWALSNVGAGTREQALSVIEGGIVRAATACVQRGVRDVANEALWALANTNEKAPHEMLPMMVANVEDVTALMRMCAEAGDTRISTVMCELLRIMLEADEGANMFSSALVARAPNFVDFMLGLDLADVPLHTVQPVLERLAVIVEQMPHDPQGLQAGMHSLSLAVQGEEATGEPERDADANAR